MGVTLEEPSGQRLHDFLAAVRRSKKLHGDYVAPPATAEHYAQYLERLKGSRHDGFFVIVEGQLAAVINVNEIVLGAFRNAYLGYYAFAPFARQGHMREGLRLCIDHCFGALELHRLEANIQPDNEPSIRLVKSLGFRLEGFSPRYLKIAGRWRDHERWAITAEEWPG